MIADLDLNERVVRARVEQIEDDLLRVLDRHTRLEVEAGHPRSGRYLAMHVLVDLVGRLMVADKLDDPERAPFRCRALVQQLDLFVAGDGARPH